MLRRSGCRRESTLRLLRAIAQRGRRGNGAYHSGSNIQGHQHCKRHRKKAAPPFETCGRRASAARGERDARSAPKRILHAALQPLKSAAETGVPWLMRRNGILFRCSNIVVFAVCTSGCYRWTYNAVMISSAFTIFLYDCGCCSSFAPTTFIFNYYCSFLHYRSVIRLTG